MTGSFRAAVCAVAAMAFAGGCGDDDEPPPPTAGQPSEQRSCGQVAFRPNTDAGAFEITAAGTGCAEPSVS